MRSVADIFHRAHGKARSLLGTFLYRLVASLAGVAFQLAINWLYGVFFKKPATTGGSHFFWISHKKSHFVGE